MLNVLTKKQDYRHQPVKSTDEESGATERCSTLNILLPHDFPVQRGRSALNSLLIILGHKTGHKTVGDGRSNPNLRHQIGLLFTQCLYEDVVVVECCNGDIDDEDKP